MAAKKKAGRPPKKAPAKAKAPPAKVSATPEPGADGTKEQWITLSGAPIEGVYADGKLCCPHCERKLPRYTTHATRVRALARREDLEERAREVFRNIADTIRKNATKAGLPEPTDAELAALLSTK